ncbi:MAG: DUF4125 family protein [Geobacteraceae bacterium]
MEENNIIIEQILELELAMFLSVPTTHRYTCQEDPESFRLHRRAQFAAWSASTLESYQRDLLKARDKECNLVAVKYARMDNLVPCENFSPFIDAIVDLAVAGQKQFVVDYPCLMRGGRPLSKEENSPGMTSFETYLRGELETYSERTLQLLYGDMLALQKSGTNLSESTYRSLAGNLGFDSLESLEETLRKKFNT